jgi:DUF2971 family protein
MLPALLNCMRPTFGRDFQGKFADRYGILSLSEVPTSLLMWAHYGNCHRGFAIELDGDHAFFRPPSGQGPIGRLLKVTYTVDRPALTMYDPSIAPEQYANNLIDALLLTKSADWRYECEYRMVLPLDDPATFPHRVDGRNHLFPFPSEVISGIVFGSRCSEATRLSVKAALAANTKLSHVRLYQAQTSDTRFEVTIHSLDAMPA